MRAFYLKALLLSLVSAMLAQSSAYADIIYLSNGGKIDGVVTKDNGTTVTIDIGSGTVVHNKKDIVGIKKEAPRASMIVPASATGKVNMPLFSGEEKHKPETGLAGMIKGVIDTAFSILKFDFLKKSK